ncbi:hypothetical protein [Clostridium sp. Ade.TY]|nr:hypothetical protein [Clostridium sp. Ade.TY]
MKFNRLILELSVSSIIESKNFYIDILGFNLEYEILVQDPDGYLLKFS